MQARWSIAGLALAALLAGVAGNAQDAAQATKQKATLSIPNTQCGRCVASLSDSLKKVKGVQSISGLTPQTKMAVVEMNPQEGSVHQLAQVVADTPGVHGKPYEAQVCYQVDGLNNAETRKKIDATLMGVKGVKAATIVDEKNNVLGIQFDKLDASAGMGVRMDAITTAFRNAGLTAQPYVPAPPSPAQP